jgi:hypothetical protein
MVNYFGASHAQNDLVRVIKRAPNSDYRYSNGNWNNSNAGIPEVKRKRIDDKGCEATHDAKQQESLSSVALLLHSEVRQVNP